jgi:hypothetical protein
MVGGLTTGRILIAQGAVSSSVAAAAAALWLPSVCPVCLVVLFSFGCSSSVLIPMHFAATCADVFAVVSFTAADHRLHE